MFMINVMWDKWLDYLLLKIINKKYIIVQGSMIYFIVLTSFKIGLYHSYYFLIIESASSLSSELSPLTSGNKKTS